MANSAAKENLEDLDLLRSNAVAAGIMAAGYFRRDMKSWSKENASPVTEADIAVDKFLRASLSAARPDYGWLSEEQEDDGSRLARKRVFIVDPIDGTRAFIKGEDCWTICIAVVEDGVAVAGVVYAPARDELYAACKGGGATQNGSELVRRQHIGPGPVIPAPGAVHEALSGTGLEYVRGPSLPSLAYRLVQVATGVLDAAVARRGAQDWDIAAAQVILSEAGVDFEDVCAGVPALNGETLRHAALAAVGDLSLKAPLHDALRRVYGCPAAVAKNVSQRQTQ